MVVIPAVVLAAGVGKRMRSARPKVLHTLCGRPMLWFVLEALREAGEVAPIVVIGHGADHVRRAIGDGVRYVEQPEPLGTGHAVMQAAPLLRDTDGPVIVLFGDTPLITPQTLRRLLEHQRATGAAAVLTSAVVDDPTGYGRVLRGGDGRVAGLVEEADCTSAQRAVREINAGAYVFRTPDLLEALPHLTRDNAQGEFYLPDAVLWLLRQGRCVEAVEGNPEEVLGINSRRHLAHVEGVMRARILDRLMDAGVTVVDPATTFVHAGVEVGQDTVIHPFSTLGEETRVGQDCVIGPHAHLIGARVGDEVTILASTVEHSEIGEGTTIGPYAHLRPGNVIGRRVEIGNYAELKNARVGDHTKIHHMSYIGDAVLGARVNIGAGTVTCNFDGRAKHVTHIEDEVFIGSDTMLVAPIRLGRGAVTGAGSVVTKDVPPRGVAVGVPARVIRYRAKDE
ncbi:MAG: bifunctional UDP-N-acetylglucosamine diphosphorylase/glucosamine-1-phosphate N-acetyltransferase GlmU [Armatimonadetes bacterium]|nr:bifunctional UDP-N-acetylglucosamine diphosphorylase/glucosamine-1-phosphate N-acetyltransferase GlmU [Armatimonadota bacterium]